MYTCCAKHQRFNRGQAYVLEWDIDNNYFITKVIVIDGIGA